MNHAGRKRGGATLRQVAAEAGVSIASVSKVLNGRGASVRVSEDTARIIRETATKLHYVPNGLARSLRMSRTQTVGLIFENFGEISAGPLFYVHLLDGLAQELFARHCRLTILPEINHDLPLSSIGDGLLDGVIWAKMPHDEKALASLERAELPFVALHARPAIRHSGTVFVSCDNAGGTGLAVQHLAKLGHDRILFVMEHGEENVPDALARKAGFVEMCRALGLPSGEEDVVVWSREAPEFTAWWQSQPPHTGIITWNEFMAAGVMNRANALRVDIPGKLSIVGFDSTPFCDTLRPRLTAVRQPIKHMAGQAARTLLDLIEGRPVSQFEQVFPCTLDIRESCGIPYNVLSPSSAKRSFQ